MVFEHYSDYYDRIYHDKDYQEECNFLKRVFDTYGEGKVRTVLDVGCGTGSHALILSAMGYDVTGIDFSEKMLRIAVNKAREQKKQINFLQGDIRHLDLRHKFDAVVAMFNVLGYLTTNRDIENALGSIRRHLIPGGLFTGDAWFGPAVLKEKPGEREKIVEQESGRIVRYARPVLDPLRQTVEVNYTVSEVKDGKETAKVEESHLIRFFFYQELCGFLEGNGMEVLKICPFLKPEKQLDEHCWNISVIGRRV
jgi:SAM-dependent methyltransferase